MRGFAWRVSVLLLGAALALPACGGGNGMGPKALKRQEDRLRDRLPLDWEDYNGGALEQAIARFTETLDQAAQAQLEPGVGNRVRAEAFSGIGWSFFRLQDLESASSAFGQATALDRQNADAWVGWAGVCLAQRRYSDVVQFCLTALETDSDYSSAFRTDSAQRDLGHDLVEVRHVRLMLAEAYFQLGRYSAAQRADPYNAAAQVRLIQPDYRYRDPGQLVQAISQISLALRTAEQGGV
ncbi:MAG: tetratricopeptide repeat protein [Candidatus Latescibacterota bacterium]